MVTKTATTSEFELVLIILTVIIIPTYPFKDYVIQNEASCSEDEFYDIFQYKCVRCGKWENDQQVQMQTRENDISNAKCVCKMKHIEVARKDDVRLICQLCSDESSLDQLTCTDCNEDVPCDFKCNGTQILVDREIDGTLVTRSCRTCVNGTVPNSSKSRCEPCPLDPLNRNNILCPPPCPLGYREINGECFNVTKVISDSRSSFYKMKYQSGKEIESKLLRSSLLQNAYKCQYYHSQQACSLIHNLCALQLYNQDNVNGPCQIYIDAYTQLLRDATKNSFMLPPLYVRDDSIFEFKDIPTLFSFRTSDSNSILPLKVARYSVDGHLLGIETASLQVIQVCPGLYSNLFFFGSWCSKSCSFKARLLWDLKTTEFYELFIEYLDNDDQTKLHPVPVINKSIKRKGIYVNQDVQKNHFLTRRFFTVDNLSGVDLSTTTKARVVQYLKSVTMSVKLQQEEIVGKIFTPILTVVYDEVTLNSYKNNTDVEITLNVVFWSEQDKIEEDISIAVGVLGALAVVFSAVQTWSWSKRSGRIAIDLYTLFKFTLFLCGNLSNVFLLVLSLVSLVRLLFYKEQRHGYMVAPTPDQEKALISYIIAAFCLKCIDLLHLFYMQWKIDIFFVDWERPRLPGQPGHSGDSASPVSVWRNYFIAREWKKLQVLRKTKSSVNLVLLLVLLKIFKLENIALIKHSSATNNDCEPFSRTFRFAIAVLFFFLVALVQAAYFRLFHDNFISDKVTRFTDLCSICNISVFILAYEHYGYYIHGRSVHGHADTDMKQFNELLKREEDNLCSQRGLVPNTALQTFGVFVTRDFRRQFDRILRPALDLEVSKGRSRLLPVPSSFTSLPSLSEQFIVAYQTMNRFLSTFIDHALQDLDYVVKDKLFTEKFLKIEFEEPTEKSFFYNDPANSFTSIFFYGHELDFLVWEILFVTLIELFVGDFLLSILIVIICYQVCEKVCRYRGKWNVAKKSLLDKRFLI